MGARHLVPRRGRRASALGASNGDPNGADPHCAKPRGAKEKPSGRGLGFELALALPALAALRRRAHRS